MFKLLKIAILAFGVLALFGYVHEKKLMDGINLDTIGKKIFEAYEAVTGKEEKKDEPDSDNKNTNDQDHPDNKNSDNPQDNKKSDVTQFLSDAANEVIKYAKAGYRKVHDLFVKD